MKQAAIFALTALCIVQTAAAANHYVRAGASGNGSDWANAYGDLPSVLTRGDTYYIADGSYGGYTFDDPNVGTVVITLKKATAGDHGAATGWNNAYGDGQAVFSGQLNFTTGYYTLDGQVRDADWAGGYGFKINASDAKGINIGSSSRDAHYNTFRYIDIAGRGNDSGGAPANDLVYVLPSVRGLAFQSCYLHDAGRCQWLFRGTDDGLIEYCLVARNESVSAQHSEAISAIGTDGWIVRYNLWEDIEGTGVIVFDGSGWELYGNVCYDTGAPGYGGVSNGSFCTWTGYTVTNTLVYNNTFIGMNGWNQGIYFDNPSGNAVYNNLWYDCERAGIDGAAADYNTWLRTPVRSGTTLQAHDVFDIAAADPFVDWHGGDFSLTAPSAAGTTLPAPYNLDRDGTTRGVDGHWDRGAIEYVDIPRLIADAGPDRTIADADANGWEQVILDGSGSYSLDEPITTWMWREGQSLLGIGTVCPAFLGVGTHTITLAVADAAGRAAFDTVVITIEAAPLTDGDCDGDGDVDLDDFVLLKLNFGTPTAATRAMGDLDGDGDVDLDDFAILKQNFGHTADP